MVKTSKDRIAIMGATGFIGCHLVEELIQDGLEVVAIGRNFKNFNLVHERLETYSCNLDNEVDIKVLFDNIKDIKTIYYLAWSGFPTTSEKDPITDYLKNLKPLLSVIPYLKNKRIIFSSSGGTVYGENPDNNPRRENDITNPISVYGMHKLLAEKYITHFSSVYNYEYIIARISNPYGKSNFNTKDQGIVDVLINNAQNNITTTIWGDGYIVRDYIHISNLISMLKTLHNSATSCEIYNLGSGNPMSIRELVDFLKRTNPTLNFKVDYNDTESRYFDVNNSQLDIEKLNKFRNFNI